MKRFISMLLTVLMLVSAFPLGISADSKLPFKDVKEGHWFYNAVKYVYEQELLSGTGDGLFAPNSDMSRSMLVTVLWRMAVHLRLTLKRSLRT